MKRMPWRSAIPKQALIDDWDLPPQSLILWSLNKKKCQVCTSLYRRRKILMGLPGLVRDISTCQHTLTCFKQSPESFEYFVEKSAVQPKPLLVLKFRCRWNDFSLFFKKLKSQKKQHALASSQALCMCPGREWIQWRAFWPWLLWRRRRWWFHMLSCLISFPLAIINIYSSTIRKKINISKQLITASKTSSKLFF